MNRLPKVGDYVTVKDNIFPLELMGQKLKVVYVAKKQSPDKTIWYEIGCTLEDEERRCFITNADIATITEGKETVKFT